MTQEAPKRIWSSPPEAEYILASEHERIVAEKDAEIARLRAPDMGIAVAAMRPILQSDLKPSAWNTDEEIAEAFSAAIRALAEKE